MPNVHTEIRWWLHVVLSVIFRTLHTAPAIHWHLKFDVSEAIWHIN